MQQLYHGSNFILVSAIAGKSNQFLRRQDSKTTWPGWVQKQRKCLVWTMVVLGKKETTHHNFVKWVAVRNGKSAEVLESQRILDWNVAIWLSYVSGWPTENNQGARPDSATKVSGKNIVAFDVWKQICGLQCWFHCLLALWLRQVIYFLSASAYSSIKQGY